ncbi:MAG: PaaI family thioesterase [Candidatus Binataceae bacterium]
MADRARIAAIESLARAPFAVVLGVEIESAESGTSTVRLPRNPSLLNDGGPSVPIHGGAIASLIDIAACAAVWSLPETRQSATISMSINFTAPGLGTDLVARARVTRKGRRLAHLTVDVRDDRGHLIADAIVTYKIA